MSVYFIFMTSPTLLVVVLSLYKEDSLQFLMSVLLIPKLSGLLGRFSYPHTTPVRWKLLLQLTILSWSAIVV